MPEVRRRVFVVDDETTIATTLALILNSHGFDAKAFTDPYDALYSAEVHSPDVLLTDVSMPKLNGIDLGVQFKAIFPECKVLLFSGHANTANLRQSAADTGHHFDLIAKPIQPKDLIATIESMVV